MIEKIIKLLQKYNFSHAVITMIAMICVAFPLSVVIEVMYVLGFMKQITAFYWLAPWFVATFVTGVYYGREVTHTMDKSEKDRISYLNDIMAALWPGNWPTAHDRWQMLWVPVAAYGMAWVITII